MTVAVLSAWLVERLQHPLELSPQIVDVLPAVLRPFRQTSSNRPVEGTRVWQVIEAKRTRIGGHQFADHAGGRPTFERRAARGQLVQHKADRENVAPLVGIASFELLG
jgi:hypothetical protein